MRKARKARPEMNAVSQIGSPDPACRTGPEGSAPVPAGGGLLRIEALEKRFGGLTALSDYHLTLHQGELVGLIGPNGAGKTTVFNLITGVLKPTSGRVVFQGREVTGLRADRRAALGIARTFQNIRLFDQLSVADNVKVPLHLDHGSGLLPTVLGLTRHRKGEREIQARAEVLLELVGLADQRFEPAGDLPYGQQRKLELARALAAGPKLLLLDEPAAGMNPSESESMVRTIFRIKDRFKLTVLLVEHDMKVVMGVCTRIQVLHRGELLAEGDCARIQTDPRVIEAYLGRKKETRA